MFCIEFYSVEADLPLHAFALLFCVFSLCDLNESKLKS